MLTGYHYTTQKSIDDIMRSGLKPLSLDPRHFDKLAIVKSFIKNNVIWLCRRQHEGDGLLGVLINIAIDHYCSQIYCLKVKYPWRDSVTMLARNAFRNTVQLKHTLTAGPYSHISYLIDLVIAPIPPDNIELIDQWDLRDVIKRRKHVNY